MDTFCRKRPSAEAHHRAGARLCCFHGAVAWQFFDFERIDQFACGGGDFCHGAFECRLVGLGRMGKAAEFANELQWSYGRKLVTA